MKKTAVALALTACLLMGVTQAQAADIATLTSKADSGDVKAMYEVGSHLLASGEKARGILYLEHVIRSGDVNAAYAHAAMGRHYASMGEMTLAREAMLYHFRQASVLGEVGSQVQLGAILLGMAAEPGSDLASRSKHQAQGQLLLEHAANAGGSIEAAYHMGKAYTEGNGLERDPVRAQTWLTKAAEGKHIPAAMLLATNAQGAGDAKTAVRYFEMAADRGDGQAMLSLANGYESGQLGNDLAAAQRWAGKAASAKVSGVDDTQARIAEKLRIRNTPKAPSESQQSDRSLVQNPARTQALPEQRSYTVASTQGPAGPGSEIEMLRMQVEQLSQLVNKLSPDRAPQVLAAAQSHDLPPPPLPIADKRDYNQKGLDAHGRGEYAEAFRHFARAARKGDADAKNNMGMLLLQGQGVEADPVRAMQLFREAAESGHITATHNIGYMYENGVGVRQDLARSRVWYQHSAKLTSRAQSGAQYAQR